MRPTLPWHSNKINKVTPLNKGKEEYTAQKHSKSSQYAMSNEKKVNLFDGLPSHTTDDLLNLAEQHHKAS